MKCIVVDFRLPQGGGNSVISVRAPVFRFYKTYSFILTINPTNLQYFSFICSWEVSYNLDPISSIFSNLLPKTTPFNNIISAEVPVFRFVAVIIQ